MILQRPPASNAIRSSQRKATSKVIWQVTLASSSFGVTSARKVFRTLQISEHTKQDTRAKPSLVSIVPSDLVMNVSLSPTKLFTLGTTLTPVIHAIRASQGKLSGRNMRTNTLASSSHVETAARSSVLQTRGIIMKSLVASRDGLGKGQSFCVLFFVKLLFACWFS